MNLEISKLKQRGNSTHDSTITAADDEKRPAAARTKRHMPQESSDAR
jgi:hypothetical protein